MGKLLLGQKVQHIALILGFVFCLLQQPALALGIVLDPGIVPGDDQIAPQNLRPVIEFGKFHVFVAVNAGIRRSPMLIGADKAVNDLFGEVLGKVKNMELHAQLAAHAAGILGIVGGAAGLSAAAILDLPGVQLHIHAHAFEALPEHQRCGNAGIYAAAHGDQRTLGFHWWFHILSVM